MKEVTTSSKAIPANPRSKNYPAGASVVHTGGGNATIIQPGGGSDVDIIKSTDSKSATDKNVLSALKSILEFLSKNEDGTAKGVIDFLNGIKLNGGSLDGIIKKGEETSPSDSNVFSAVRTLAEILANNEELKKLFLGKYGPDRTDHLLEMLGGIFVRGGIDTDSITTLNILVQELADIYDLNVTHVATMFRTIINDYVSSETFIPGLMGEGMKIYKALNGDWNLEIDNVVVRKVMTIFELVVSKIRSVNGGLVISPANGRIKSVAETTGDPTYYVLGIEGDNQFVFDDLVRCQVFTSGQAKYYWVPVASVTADAILILKSEFSGVVPAIGDDLIQMGNRTNKARQGLLYLTASEDGKPRFSVMDGVNSTSTVGKSKVILGCLDGMTDTDFPADFQPSGWGLYAMNVFLKGVFLLRNGKTVESEVESAKSDAQTAKDKANTVYDLFQAFTVAGGLFESKISEVKTYADGKVDGLQIGGRNLVLNSDRSVISGGYHVTNYTLSEDIISGGEYSISVCGYIGSWDRTFDIWAGGGVTRIGLCKMISSDLHSITFIAPETIEGNGNRREINVYTDDGAILAESHINKIKLERGNKATDWTPAPEDVAADAQDKANAAQAAAEAVALAQAALAKTEARAYADGIVTAEEQRAIADAQAKLNEAKQDAQNKAEAAKNAAINDAAQKYPTHSEVQSSIRQTKDEINLSVTEKISNVQVGGTNLLKNSGNWRSEGWNGGFGSNGGGYIIDNSILYNGVPTLKTCVGTGLSHPWLLLENNVEYTYSAMVKCNTSIGSSGSTPLHYHAGYGQYNEGKISIIHDDTAVTPDTWKLIKITFKLTDNADSFRPFFYRGGDTDVFYWIANIKLERGNKATDWTPAPEDIQTQITANASAIEVNRQGIALKASQEQVNGIGNRLEKAEGSLTVQAGQISAAVSSVDNLSGRMSSAELKLDPSQIWLGIKSNVSALVPTCTKQIDTKGLDPNKYYLATIRMSTTILYTITVERSLDGSYGVPPYSAHSGGFSLLCRWQSNGYGWGTIAVKRIIQTLAWSFVDTCPVGSIGQIYESSEEVIYVRGGSVYNVRVDGTSYTDINLHTGTYTPYPDYPSSSRPGVIDSVSAPVVDLDTKLTEEQVKAGIGITENGLTVFGKFIDFTGRVTFTSMSADAQNRITAAQNTANAANGAAGSAQSTANDAVNKANAAQGTANTGVANAIAAQGTANDAWNRANNAQTSANNVDLALGSLRNSLGGLAYDNAVTLAKLDSTIIDGGYIKTNLINARAIVTGALIAEQIAATNITTGKLTVTNGATIGNFKISDGSLSAEHTPAVIGFIYGGNSASLGAGSLIVDKQNTGYAIRVNGGAGLVRMDIDTFEVIAKGGMSVTNSYGTALAINGGIKVNGVSGKTFTVDTFEDWIGGRNKVTYRYVNGILVDYWYR